MVRWQNAPFVFTPNALRCSTLSSKRSKGDAFLKSEENSAIETFGAALVDRFFRGGKTVENHVEIFVVTIMTPTITDFCRELRRRETPAEKVLWHHLRNRKLFDHKFLRQYPICFLSAFGRYSYYIPDFYCHQAKLVVEADGPIHLLKKDYDKHRDEALMSLNPNHSAI